MTLPLQPPLQPQLARGKTELPDGEGWAFEPKYDGFRAIAFVDGDEVRLMSRGGKQLERYFPELTFPAGRYVVDGEIVIDAASGAAEAEDFDALSNRIHPAASRIEMLSQTTPARYIAFDLLALDDDVWMERPFSERRAQLERFVTPEWVAGTTASLTPSVGTAAEADQWLNGWRPGKEEGTVGSLMLGLYNPDGELHVVGHTSGLKAKEKRELVTTLAPYETGERGSADPSRWRSSEELQWVALRPELVIEVSFDQVSAGRIRHGAKLLRWRDDKPPAECTVDQLDQ
jgi:ATP-dependent DNA ligase